MSSEIEGQLSVTKLLVAVLQTLGEVKIPEDIFLSVDDSDKEASLEYDNEANVFILQLKEKDHGHDHGHFHDGHYHTH